MSEFLVKFLRADGTGPYSGFRWPLPTDDAPGAWVTVAGTLEPCSVGYHLCRPQDVASWLNAAAYEAEYRGERIDVDEPGGEGKVVVREARLVRRLHAWDERAMRLFACDCAERVLPIYEAQHRDDQRPREAIAVARRFANGEATRDALDAARAAAWDAAGDAAWAAAGDAAWDAARAAAGAAAGDAAGDAAWNAAWAAAWAAAGDAAWDAAWDAERSWQGARFQAYITGTAQPLTAADLIVPQATEARP